MLPMDTPKNASVESKIRAILKPLENGNSSAEYMYHFKSMMEFDRNVRAIEFLYANLYSQVMAVEKQIALQKNIS